MFIFHILIIFYFVTYFSLCMFWFADIALAKSSKKLAAKIALNTD